MTDARIAHQLRGRQVVHIRACGRERYERVLLSPHHQRRHVYRRDLLRREHLPSQAEAVERFAFYERVKRAYAIVVTGELQPWGNFILRKGVIGDTLRT